MKKLITLTFILFASVQIFAQVQFNPQVGFNVMNLKNPPAGVDFDGKLGFTMGADLRFGQRLQLQPGVHYVRSVTAFQQTGEAAQTGDIVYQSFKLKALGAYNIINGDLFKFRVNFGPAYDFLLTAVNKSTEDDLKDDFKKGTFFLQGGLGVDILFLTADLGYQHGLSQTLAGEGAGDSKNAGIYFTVGIAFGHNK